jgi:hypothetical protein
MAARSVRVTSAGEMQRVLRRLTSVTESAQMSSA